MDEPTLTERLPKSADADEGLQSGRRSIALLTALHSIGTKLAGNLDAGAVIAEVLETATSLLGARSGSLMLLDAEGEHLVVAAARGLDQDVVRDVRVPVGAGVSGWVARTGQPRIILDGVTDTLSPGRERLDAALSVPLKARDQVIGVLNLSGRLDGGDFDDEDLSLLMMLANQAAVAIDNARLHEERERKLHELYALFAVGHALNSSLARDETLHLVLHCGMELLGARHGSLMLVDESGQYLEIVAAHGLSDEIIRGARPRLGEGIAGHVAASGQPVLMHRGRRDDHWREGPEGVTSAISVPIRRDGSTIGVLNVRDRASGGEFSDGDLQMLLHLADQAAVAIANATLVRNLRDLFIGTVRALVNAIDARDPYTEKHSARVAACAAAVGAHLGFDAERVDQLRIAALLHDIGKISIRDHILLKPGELTDAEYAVMKQHPIAGARIMEHVEHLLSMLPFIIHHHEQYGAGGYPTGLQGEEIPLEARILAVCDAFDAMTTERPYRAALPLSAATEELRRCAGTQFDAAVAEAFLSLLRSGAIAETLADLGR